MPIASCPICGREGKPEFNPADDSADSFVGPVLVQDNSENWLPQDFGDDRWVDQTNKNEVEQGEEEEDS